MLTMDANTEYRGKRVLVVGLAGTGVETARFFLERGAEVTVSDKKALELLGAHAGRLQELAAASAGKLTLETGGHQLASFLSAQLIVVSPGVPLANPECIAARRAGIEVVAEVEIAFRHLKGKIVGITGANGKTTVTALTGHLLQRCGLPTFIAGNIGAPYPPLIACVGRDDEKSWLVTELSSFQLEGTDRFCCHTSVLLNITPDHQDRYATFEDYAQAKARIFRNQTADQHAVLNGDDPVVLGLLPQVSGRVTYFSLKSRREPGLVLEGEGIEFRDGRRREQVMRIGDIPLKGMHNVENVMAALAVGLNLGLETGDMIEAVKSFKPVEHRLEWVGEISGIDFYNDSKATNMDSCIKALESFNSPILLILGGRNKGGKFSVLRDLAREKVKRILAIGESQGQIVEALSDSAPITECASMQQAVESAFQYAHDGDTVLLAPACASFDMFRNFEHRGQAFKEEVARLHRHPGLTTVH
jgi:UDP-N-acetylmuramoylalanine--D-glutamate ligase